VSSRPAAAAHTRERAETAKRAVATVFVLNGFAFAARLGKESRWAAAPRIAPCWCSGRSCHSSGVPSSQEPSSLR